MVNINELLSGFAYILGKDRESFEAETPCAVMVLKDGVLTECGWWNENNEPCVYHPDGKEIKAESFEAHEYSYYYRNKALKAWRKNYEASGILDDRAKWNELYDSFDKYKSQGFSQGQSMVKSMKEMGIYNQLMQGVNVDAFLDHYSAESFEALDDSSLCVICKENEATEGTYETIVCEDCAYGTASNPGWSNWSRTNNEDRCPSCNSEEELWVGDWMRCSKCNDSFCENCETDGQTLCEQCFENKGAESFEAESQEKKTRYKITMDSWPMRIHVDGCPIAKNIPKEHHWEGTFTPQEVAQTAYDTLFYNESLPQFEGNTFGELRKTYAKDLIIPCNCTIHEMKSIKELDPATFTRQPNETQEHWDAESFEAEGGRWGKGNLKLSNSEITQLLLYENWKCSNCDNSIKNKQNIPFSEEEKNDITWTIFAPEYDLQNYDDINIVTKGIRGTKGNVVKLEDGTLNFDNLHVLCNGCGQRKKIGRAATLSFRTSKEKKEWLKSLAKDKNKGMAEIMSDVIDEYRNNYEEESFEAEYTLNQMAEKSFKEIDNISGFVADRLNHTQESWSKLPITKRQKILRKIRKDEDGWFDIYSLDAESFEAENLYNSQKENMTLVALGRAHKQILDGPSRATMEIRVEDKPVIFAIYEAANYFAPLTNPIELQSRYDSHNFVEPDWRDEYHQALSALKEAFPSWSMFSPKLEKSFDL